MSLALNVTEVKTLLEAQTNRNEQQPWDTVEIANRVFWCHIQLQLAYGEYKKGECPLGLVRDRMRELRLVLRIYRELRDGVYDPTAHLS